MTEQLNIFDEQYQKPLPTRLVDKHYMHNLEWGVYEELKLHLTKDYAIKACELAELFETTTRQLRDVISTLRSKQNAKIIGDSNGYYIGSELEFEQFMNPRTKRTMSSMKTTLDLDPNRIKLFYWLLNQYDKTGILKGQTQLQFNGWEREFIRQFAEDYMETAEVN